MTQPTTPAWPEVVADVRLRATAEGGKAIPILSGYRCPCTVAEDSREGWDVRLDVGDEPFRPGTERRVRMLFLTPEGRAAILAAGTFFLREARVVGEATVVAGDQPHLTPIAAADADASLVADLGGDLDGVAFFEAPVEGGTHNQRWNVAHSSVAGRAGVVLVGTGSGAQPAWTDCSSAADGLRRFLADDMLE